MTVYRVLADTARVRAAPNTRAAILARLPKGSLIESAFLHDGEKVLAIDDPATPEPARKTRLWVERTKASGGGFISIGVLERVSDT